MNLKALRKRCEARLSELELYSHFDARAFCDALAARRGRPILVCPVASQAGPCGLWIGTPSADYIFFERDTSRLHQEHIILHEASHILCGHRSAEIAEADVPRLFFPDLRTEMV